MEYEFFKKLFNKYYIYLKKGKTFDCTDYNNKKELLLELKFYIRNNENLTEIIEKNFNDKKIIEKYPYKIENGQNPFEVYLYNLEKKIYTKISNIEKKESEYIIKIEKNNNENLIIKTTDESLKYGLEKTIELLN